jgi:hypothetical protein
LVFVGYTERGYYISCHTPGSYILKIGYYKHVNHQKYDKSTGKYVHTRTKLNKYVRKTIKINSNKEHYLDLPYLYGGYKGDQDKAVFIVSFDILELKCV